ncbi:MAG: helix-turn-helix transcriptional regulator [Clostridia bacterium]|nr:helix-turn-helix transcriptional regulator [Clostridia bacterium]
MDYQNCYVCYDVIKFFRKRKKLSKRAFCSGCGISLGELRQVKNKGLNFDANILLKISKFTQIPLNQFFIQIK